jgi:hypothetical protein
VSSEGDHSDDGGSARDAGDGASKRRWAVRRAPAEEIAKRRHACPMCDYRARQPSKLVIHMRVHTGERPFKCRFCDYTCAQSSRLNVHERMHRGERPHKCDLCSFCTLYPFQLAKHRLVHETGGGSFDGGDGDGSGSGDEYGDGAATR